MNITIILSVDDEDADPNDATGLTEEMYLRAMDRLSDIGEIVDIRAGGE